MAYGVDGSSGALSLLSLARLPPGLHEERTSRSSLVSLVARRLLERATGGGRQRKGECECDDADRPRTSSPCRVSPSRNAMATYPSPGKKQVSGGVGGRQDMDAGLSLSPLHLSNSPWMAGIPSLFPGSLSSGERKPRPTNCGWVCVMVVATWLLPLLPRTH